MSVSGEHIFLLDNNMKNFENNLVQGRVVRQLFIFSIPFVLSSLVQNLYGMADMIIIGQFAGTASLAGVNTGAIFVSLITNMAIGFCNGGTVLIGQFAGRNDREQLRRIIGTLCGFILLLALLLTPIFLFLRDPILRLLQVPAESWSEAADYYLVSVIGFVFIFGYNLLSAILRGMGDSRNPFLFVCIACVINIILDLVFVGSMGMGALGAALATVIAQGCSMLLCLFYLKRRDFVFSFGLKNFRIHKESLALLMRVGIPTTVQNTVGSFAFSIMTAITNTLGVEAAAAMAGGQKVTLFAVLPSIALGNAIAAMCAQNFGAGRRDRALKTMGTGLALIFGINLLLFAAIEAFPEALMRMFGGDSGMIELGSIYLRLCSFDFLFIPFQGALVGYLIGSGHAALPAGISICSSLLFRVPATYLIGIVWGQGIAGVALATPITSFVVALFCLFYYFSGRCHRIEAIVDQ